jgi:hypothetical protein
MNKHIKELHDRACMLDMEQYPNTIPDGERIQQKFAELIVEECLGIMKDEKHNTTMLLSNPTESGAIYDAMYNIKSHFGVK